MKSVLFFLIYLFCLGHTFAQNKRLTYEVKDVRLKGEVGYLNNGNPDSIKAEPQVRQFARCIADGRYQTLQRFFASEQAYQEFIARFSYDGTVRKVKPQKVISIGTNVLVVEDRISNVQSTISFSINATNDKIEQVSVAGSGSNLRIEATLPFNYVKLPEKADDKLDYLNAITEAYQYNPDMVQNIQEVMFGQVDFADLAIKLNYCYQVPFFGSVCGEKTYNYGLGPVISGKDIEGYAPEEQEEAFSEIADITAFSSAFNNGSGAPVPYLPRDYVLTAVIVDRGARSIVFFREGLEPWEFTGEEQVGRDVFANPIAAKVLNQTIYVLDKGNQLGAPAGIHALKINHAANGDYSVTYIGMMNIGSLSLSNPTDVGGYLGSPHTLMVTDANGLHLIPVSDGTASVSGTIRTITQFQDPIYTADYYSVKNAKRVDSEKGDGNGGTTIIITDKNEVIAVSNVKLALPSTSFDYKKHLFGNSDITNLAYMSMEKMWCLTDNSGKLHKLDKYGRYMGGDGKFGTSEVDGELYFPVGLTPNPIADLSNPYRYRFIVANRWGIETGMKLFAPIFAFNELDVFENLNDGKLSVAFVASGMWQAVEGIRSIKFDGFYLNGALIPVDKWKNQINDLEQSNYLEESIDYLSGVPNIADFLPSDLTGLKRG